MPRVPGGAKGPGHNDSVQCILVALPGLLRALHAQLVGMGAKSLRSKKKILGKSQFDLATSPV